LGVKPSTCHSCGGSEATTVALETWEEARGRE
jgi:hypothetical protein